MEEQVGWTTTEHSANKRQWTHLCGGTLCSQDCRHRPCLTMALAKGLCSVRCSRRLITLGHSAHSCACIPLQSGLPHLLPDAYQITSACHGIGECAFFLETIHTGMHALPASLDRKPRIARRTQTPQPISSHVSLHNQRPHSKHPAHDHFISNCGGNNNVKIIHG